MAEEPSSLESEDYEYRIQIRCVYRDIEPGPWFPDPQMPPGGSFHDRAVATHFLSRRRATQDVWDNNYARRGKVRPFRFEHRLVRCPASAWEPDPDA